ncbi:MAG: DUF1616 domain-containing protein [Candidatus Diapherotrites archaeon]|nr:DUF1616 domain-containing protein [Candidatus Diapherotrites archaeon]
MLANVILSAAQKIIGFIIFLFLPGFALTYALFLDEFNIVERIFMAVPFSFAVSSLSIFYLYYFFGIGITALNSIATVISLTTVFVFIAIARKILKRRKTQKGRKNRSTK